MTPEPQPKGRRRAPVEDLTRALGERLPRRRAGPLYAASLALVTIALAALPLMYVALVGAVGWAWWWYLNEGLGLLPSTGGRGRGLRFFGYLLPLFAGAVVFVFLLKPLFARRAKSGRKLMLRPEEEPNLFAFVARLAEVVGAPRPRRIDVHLEPDASASFRRGTASLFGRDLVLSIGLPLVACLDLAQLTSVLAHELGHFNQRAGMGCNYLIRRVNRWFERAVHGRDRFDATLERWSSKGDPRLLVFLLPAWACVGATRCILHGLMLVAHALSALSTRHMERDADRCAVELAGSEVMAETLRLLTVIACATEVAHEDVDQVFLEGTLPDDLPALVRAELDGLGESAREQIVAQALMSQSGLLETHPGLSERVRRALALGVPPRLWLEARATVLFSDFAELSREVTERLYAEMLGDRFDPAALVASTAVAEYGTARQAADQLATRFFGGLWYGLETLPLERPPADGPRSPAAVLEDLRAARERLASGAGAAAAAWGELAELEDRARLAAVARRLLKVGLPVPPRDFGLSGADPASATWALEQARSGFEQQLNALAAHARDVSIRVRNSAALLSVEAVRSRLEGAEALVDRARRAQRTLADLDGVRAPLRAARRSFQVLHTLSFVAAEMTGPEIESALRSETRATRARLRELREALADRPDPFGRPGDLATQLIEVPADSELWEVLRAAEASLARVELLNARVLAELAYACGKSEGAMNLPSLELQLSP